MNDLEHLVAIEQIKQLKARYFRCVDTKDWRGLSEIFAPNAEMQMNDVNVGGEGDVVRTGPAIVKLISSLTEELITVHHAHMPEISVDSLTSARGTWAMEDLVRWREGNVTKTMHGFGYYDEEYVAVGRAWQISRVILNRLVVFFD